MKFTAPEGKQVMFKGKIITARDGGFDTDDKDLIELLSNLKDVKPEEKKRGRPRQDESPE